jgi:hypothetical protein
MNTRIHDTISVIIPNGIATLLIHLLRSVDPRLIIEALPAAVSIGYTLWRWRKDAKGDK